MGNYLQKPCGGAAALRLEFSDQWSVDSYQFARLGFIVSQVSNAWTTREKPAAKAIFLPDWLSGA